MKSVNKVPLTSWILTVCVVGVLFGSMGCISVHWPFRQSRQAGPKFQVVPRNTRSTVALTADDIARIMGQIGFTDRQIMEYGWDLRAALMTAGGANIVVNGEVEAMFAVNDDHVWITGRHAGYFVYDAKSGRFGIGPSSTQEDASDSGATIPY